ncbi:MAG: hypothetical protein AB8B56_11120, partial [Crocinitomicaceae bacterium]
MKTILLFSGSMLLLMSCSDPSNGSSSKPLSDQEMKDLVEAEEIEFDNDSITTTTSVINQVDTNILERPTYPAPPRPPSLPRSEWPIVI